MDGHTKAVLRNAAERLAEIEEEEKLLQAVFSRFEQPNGPRFTDRQGVFWTRMRRELIDERLQLLAKFAEDAL